MTATPDPVVQKAALAAAQASVATFERDGRGVKVRDRPSLEAFLIAKIAEAFIAGAQWQKNGGRG